MLDGTLSCETFQFKGKYTSIFGVNPSHMIGLAAGAVCAVMTLSPNSSEASPVGPDTIVADFRAATSVEVELLSAVLVATGADAKDKLTLGLGGRFGFHDAEILQPDFDFNVVHSIDKTYANAWLKG